MVNKLDLLILVQPALQHLAMIFHALGLIGGGGGLLLHNGGRRVGLELGW